MNKIFRDVLFPALKIIISIVLGFGTVIFLFRNEFKSIDSISFGMNTWITLMFAFCLICLRDLAFSYRFRLLCRPEKLSFFGSLRTNYMCEFVSAITPSAVGGSAMTVLYLGKEGISSGRASAIMIATLMLDEIFFVIGCPLCFIFFSGNQLLGDSEGMFHLLKIAFFSVYILLVIYTLFLFISIFFKPDIIRTFFRVVAKIPYIKRYSEKTDRFALEMSECNYELSRKSISFWLKAFMLTAIAWLARYLVVCVLLFPFINYDSQGIVLARQFTIWIMQIIAPTPGGSGFSEFLFSKYYSDFGISGILLLTVACEWRIITYYIYIIIGFVFLTSYKRSNLKEHLLK